MGRMGNWWLLAAIGVFAQADVSAAKLGLKAQRGEIRAEGLSLGRTYNLRSFRDATYVLENGGDRPVEVGMVVQQPHEKALKDGYESIPDPSWIRVVPDKSVLAVGGGAYAEIFVSIPDDPRWAGRRFHGVIMSSTRGTGMISAGVRTNLLLSTLTSHSGDKAAVDIPEFELDPPVLALPDFPVGREVSLEKGLGRAVRVISASKRKLKIRFEQAAFGALKLPDGYEQAPPEVRFRPRPWMIKLKAQAARDWGFDIELPAEAHGKKYALLIKASLKDYPVELEEYMTVLIDAEKK